MRLDGKVALITGAANGLKDEIMGFGGATAWLFAREGAKVVLTDIDEKSGNETVSQILGSGGNVSFMRLDVTNEQNWIDVVHATVSRFGKLDVLFNNAGFAIGKTVEETTVEDWDSVMDANAKGVFLGTKHAIPEMRKIGGGSIINMSSVHGTVGSPKVVAYCAAKGAVSNFTKAVAVAYAHEGIRINSVHPGNSLTGRVANRYSDGDYPESLTSGIPMGRMGDPDEIAQGVLYLASDESSYVTGSELVIDGGFLAG